jgi:uncharacterized membrane protein
MKNEKTALGLDRNIEAALCYLGAWITGLLFLLLEKKDTFVRFHAMQSLITFAGLTILAMVPLVGWILSPLVLIISFVVWLICLIKAYQGEKFKLPIIGDFAEKQVNKV